MFFDSKNFRLLEAGTNAAWLQSQLHLQNISNQDTPGYKAQGLVFRDLLTQAESDKGTYRASVVTDEAASARPDGNNVNVEAESLELYKAYVQYSLLLDKAKGAFSQYDAVLNANMN